MRIIKILILCLIASLIMTPISVGAFSLDNLPTLGKSKQWEVVIGQPDNNNLEPKNGVFNVYSMDIKYVGEQDIKIKKVEAFRDEPQTSSDIELFTVDFEKENNMNLQPSFHHQNFPLSVKAENLKVTVTWSDKNDNFSRSYKKEFVFKQ